MGDDADGSDDPSRLSGIFDNILVRQKLTVEGGENGEDTSTFRGPVTFDKRVTFKEQFAVPALNIQGRRSRGNKVFTLSDKTTYTANGSISYVGYNTSFIGEIKTEPGWRRWGLISKAANKWDVDLDILNVKEKLTVGGIEFTGVGISQLNLNNLYVTGVSTFLGDIYGNNSNILSFKDTISVGSGDTTTTISRDGRTINLGITTSFPNLTYGLRIRRDVGIGSVKSQILHRGNDVLEIKAENTGGSISLGVVNGHTLNLQPLLSNRSLVSIATSSNSSGTGGAHLSIQNIGSGDATISWKQGSLNEGFWFAGLDIVGPQRKWKLAYSGEGVGISNASFTSLNTYLGISTSGSLEGQMIRTSSEKLRVGSASTDRVLPTEKAIVDYTEDTYLKRPPEFGNSFIILHVASSEANAITGPDSVPGGYPTDGVDYTGNPSEDSPYRRTLYNTITEALAAASANYVPLGAELIISVHDELAYPPNKGEAGPLMISNSWAPVVVAGARGATNSKVKIVTGGNNFIQADTRFPQFDFNILSAGVIFQDIDIDIEAAGALLYFLTFNGGFGVNERNANINWLKCKSNAKYINSTASYGEKIQFRCSFTPSSSNQVDRYIKTTATADSGQATTSVSMMDQVGGLAGQGVDVLFDFKTSIYGDEDNSNNNQQYETLGFEFNHIGFTNPVKLQMIGIGGRGNCTIASRVGPIVKWNFNNKDWDMSEFYSGFQKRFNICGSSFRTTSNSNYNINQNTANSINNSGEGGVVLKYGARIWTIGGQSGPFSLYSELQQNRTISGVGIRTDLIRLAPVPADAFIYDS